MIFKSLFGKCSICEGNYKEHKATLLNIIPNDGSNFQVEFLDLLKKHVWDHVLSNHGRKNPDYYPLDILALRCVNSKIAVIAVGYEEAFIPIEFVFSYEVLTIEESKVLELKVNPDRWIFVDGKLSRTKRKVGNGIKNIRMILRKIFST